MTEFSTSLDICNRALQIAGAARIAALTDDTREAAECSAAYDKIRQSELRTNSWRFAVRKAALRALDTTTLVLVPKAYSATIYYQFQAVVSYGGLYWQNMVSMNYANTPGVGDSWVPYFGPLSVSSYDTTAGTSYFRSELVYYAASGFYGVTINDVYQVYAATTDQVSANPYTAPTYDATVTYAQGDTISYNGSKWISTISNNIANTPTATYARWASGTTYGSGTNVIAPATGRLYTSAQAANTGHEPTGDDGTWWTVKAASPYFQAWVDITGEPNAASGWSMQPLGITLAPPKILYPVGSGPVSELTTRNVYMLPSGFLRTANQNPLPGGFGALGGPMNNMPSDWEFENNFFVTTESDPIVFRFGADITNVAAMDPLFCEAVAAKLAMAVIPVLTQSDGKLRTAGSLYTAAVTQARIANGIDMGSSQPPQDDYISVRS